MLSLAVLVVVAAFALAMVAHADSRSGETMQKYLKRTGAKYIKEMAAKEGNFLLKSGILYILSS